MSFYQIGGFQSHSQRWFGHDKAELVNALMPAPDAGPLQLVLAIKPSGASALLLPTASHHWTRLRRDCNLHDKLAGRPHHASEYLSLSPIQFASPADLTAKITSLTPKSKKNGRSEDNSPANKAYLSAPPRNPKAYSRALFEHNRVLLRVLQDQALDVSQFGLVRSNIWTPRRFLAFTFNTWTTNIYQPLTVVDLGWTTFTVSASVPPMSFSTSVHLRPDKQSKLGVQSRKPAEFAWGKTDILTEEEISAQLRALLNGLSGHDVLLVYDKQRTAAVLDTFNVSLPSGRMDIRDLLGSPPPPPPQDYGRNSSGWGSGARARSRSPRRGDDAPGPARRRPYSPPHARNSQPCIVDVRNMYATLKNLPDTDGARNPVADAVDLGLPGRDEWCAGNESRLLAEMWYSLADGPAIDQQSAMRPSNMSAPASACPPPAVAFDPDDPDFDPNDVQPMPAVKPMPAASTVDWHDNPDWSDPDDDERFY
ncbi:hypothetical protein FA95DRAFT_1673795 [Auriscalpium vulgare]|uniref:Uncharacterized protein n=1 Tax=Auriscalpium vulgare TaxID=40419 RepID=A0ACB8SDA2_9AGAM|nr:hypothetical protein FA95DRAFT_1673795 [Auriscalpium vulgare]